MSRVTFADVVHQSATFSTDTPAEAIVLELVDTSWFQRLRDVSQTANTRLVYMFSEHSRFGHCLGVAHLANILMQRLKIQAPQKIARFQTAISAAALLHDIGHLAPGSHTAYKTWFSEKADDHEQVAIRIIQQEPELQNILNSYGTDVLETTCAIIREDQGLPAWTWEIISGGGWNVDRGNWCIVDSILAGVSYGKYNIPALTESIVISDNDHLALRENRLDAMMHFAVSRHAMYKQMYQHRVLLAADMLNVAIVKRARELGAKLEFADDSMLNVLTAQSSADLELKTIFEMRESWWRYHLMRWSGSSDQILSDLSKRLLNRRLFKTVRIRSGENLESTLTQAKNAVHDCGYDPEYYLHHVETGDMHQGDSRHSMQVLLENGKLCPVSEVDPLFNALLSETRLSYNSWIVMPTEAKLKLGRER